MGRAGGVGEGGTPTAAAVKEEQPSVSLLLGPGPPASCPGPPASMRNHAASRDLGRGTGRCAFTQGSKPPWLWGLKFPLCPQRHQIHNSGANTGQWKFKKREKKSHLERGGEEAAFYLAATWLSLTAVPALLPWRCWWSQFCPGPTSFCQFRWRFYDFSMLDGTSLEVQTSGLWLACRASISISQFWSDRLDSGLVLGSARPLSWCTEGRVLGRGPTTSRGLP